MPRTVQTVPNDKIVNNALQVLAGRTQAAQRGPMENRQKDRATGAAPNEPPSPLALSLQALDRIEAALSRLENAAPACVARDVDLQRRHQDLKASVAQSLAGLDELLAGQVAAEKT